MSNEAGGGIHKLICLLCDSQFSQDVTWRALFLLKPDEKVLLFLQKQIKENHRTYLPPVRQTSICSCRMQGLRGVENKDQRQFAIASKPFSLHI